MLVGVISDTHGLLRPQAMDALRDANVIIHAGDIGKPDILEKLRDIAPVFAVKEMYTQDWAERLPDTQTVPVGVHKFCVLHDFSQLAIDPLQAGVAAIIFGHSHKPSIETRNGVIYLNPGSAGPRRFSLPICIARILVSGKRLEPSIVHLDAR